MDNFFYMWIIMKKSVENYPFMTKILQNFYFLYNIFFQKATQNLKFKKLSNDKKQEMENNSKNYYEEKFKKTKIIDEIIKELT